MRFQKINDNVIRCTMTQEEMKVQGINIDDLMDDRAKAEEFLQYVLTKARYEVDFVTSGDVLNVQLSVMKDGEVSMMISDDQNAAIRAIAEQFKEKLREFSKVFEGASTEQHEAIIDIEPKDNLLEGIGGDENGSDPVSHDFWIRLSSIDDCIRMARALTGVHDAHSSLYKYYGEYYICTHLDLSKSEIAKVVFIMSEYSDDVSSESSEYLMVSEHGEVLIADYALRDLASIG